MSNPNCPFCGAKDIYKCGSWGIDAQETRNPLCREREAHNQTKRERDEAREQYDNLATEHVLAVNKLAEERDEAREQIKELIYIAERAIALAEIDFENDKFGVVSELRDGVERIKEGAK